MGAKVCMEQIGCVRHKSGKGGFAWSTPHRSVSENVKCPGHPVLKRIPHELL